MALQGLLTDILEANLLDRLHEVESNLHIFSLLNVETRPGVTPERGGRGRGDHTHSMKFMP